MKQKKNLYLQSKIFKETCLKIMVWDVANNTCKYLNIHGDMKTVNINDIGWERFKIVCKK